MPMVDAVEELLGITFIRSKIVGNAEKRGLFLRLNTAKMIYFSRLSCHIQSLHMTIKKKGYLVVRRSVFPSQWSW